jgi:preprotein translocase subunit YajC
MMYFGNLVMGATAAAASSSTSSADSTLSMLETFLPIIAIFVALYLFMIMPQRKKEKKIAQMRQQLQVGDNVTTVGGVVGRVVSVKDDAIVIETGADRNKLQIKKWAIQSVETIHDVQA